MSNFIAKFLNDKLKEKNNNNTKNFVDEHKLKNEKQNNNESKEKIDKNNEKQKDNENKKKVDKNNEKQNNNESKEKIDKNDEKVKDNESDKKVDKNNEKQKDNENKKKVDKNNEKQKDNENKKKVDKNNEKVKDYESKEKVDKNNEKQNIETGVNKELSGYLGNDLNLDNTIKNMNIKEMEKNLNIESSDIKTVKKSKKNIIKIQKEKPYKNLLWIFIEFLIGVILIIVSVIHIDKNIAEYKFMRSSINLWTNTFNGIVSKFDGIIGNNVREGYIKKRQDLVSDLKTYEDKLKSCDKKGKDKMDFRLINLKEQLENTNYLTLDKFIDNYEEYNLDVDAIKASVDDLCK